MARIARAFVAAASLVLAGAALAQAPREVFVEVDTGRTVSGGGPAVMRAILTLPAAKTETVLLFFRGNPGYMLARSVADKRRNIGWFIRGGSEALLLEAGIALAQVDCPTDEWGASMEPPATRCLNDYRRSEEHANDVRKLMARLRADHGLARFFVMGHSLGSVSSRWLAINLRKDEVAGTIHSASINYAFPRGFQVALAGNLSNEFPRRAAGAPMLHVHHEHDACTSTPYAAVRDYAQGNLVTVRGGVGEGDPCGGRHLHSYMGREAAATRALVTWITTGRVEPVVGE